MPDANETVELTLERANRLFVSGLGNTLGILKEADAHLSARLHAVAKKQGPASLRFSDAQALAYRQQIRLVQKYMDERLLGHTHAQALTAVASGVKTSTALLKKLDKQFAGLAKPLQLESQAQQDAIVKGTGSSLLRQHVTSVGRYSTAMINDFERVMRVGALEGLSQHQVISRLVTQGELGGINAQKLHEKEPGYFPKPSGYVVRRYWAERIVRTETAYAYNAANQATIATAKVVDFPDMQKKILAHFDQRTAPDSIAVHGQIRPVDGLFCDGAGRMYKHPPARPNDRETVIPWRPHWGELAATHPAPPAVQVQAELDAAPGLAPATEGQNLVHPSRAKIVALVEAAKAKQGQSAKDAAISTKYAQAQAAAARAQLKGTELMGSVKLADVAQLAKAQALQQAKSVKLPATTAELQAKAAAYKLEIQAKAAQKLADAQAAAAAKLKTAAQKHLVLLGEEAGELFDNPGPDLVKHLKKTAKERPELFAEMKKQLGIGGDSSHWISVAMAKKLAPELDYSSFKKKAPGTPVPPTPHVPPPKLPPLEFKVVSGYIDIHDATTGAKLAYMKPAPDGGVSVTPPAHLGMPAKTFPTNEAGAAYALEVSAKMQLHKAEAAAELVKKQKAQDELEALSVIEKAEKLKSELGKPVAMLWSSKWKAPERPLLPMTDRKQVVSQGLAKPSRAGVSVAVDGDVIEDFQVHFVNEVVDGKAQRVARFRVNEQHSFDVLAALSNNGGKAVDFPGFPKLTDLKSPTLTLSRANAVLQKVPGIEKVYEAQIEGAHVRYFTGSKGGSTHAAMKNVMEVRLDMKHDPWDRFSKVAEKVGIKTNEPKAADVEAYKQAKVLSVADKIGALQVGALKGRTPEKVNAIWQDAVKRDPRLREILDDAALRKVAPGQYALYSDVLAERYRALGITHLTHRLSGGEEVITQMLASEESGLLGSRERFQRGLIFRGMSTDTDFETGGADSVFTRLRTTKGVLTGSGVVEIDHSELGRLDVYAFNFDMYGKAGADHSSSRLRLSELEALRVSGSDPGSSNETMLRRTVPRAAIRRVMVDTVEGRARMLAQLEADGVTEINGIPVGELVVYR